MTAVATRVYRLGEFHSFDGGGRKFLYLVPAGAIFEQDESVGALIGQLSGGNVPHEELVGRCDPYRRLHEIQFRQSA